jgi:acetyl-CoA acyltransferase
MGLGPVAALVRACQRADLHLDQLDLVEINEAFAVQVLACLRELPLDPARVNPQGGALALGHPLGATGARLVGSVALRLHQGAGRYAAVAMCVGGGQGMAMILERATETGESG